MIVMLIIEIFPLKKTLKLKPQMKYLHLSRISGRKTSTESQRSLLSSSPQIMCKTKTNYADLGAITGSSAPDREPCWGLRRASCSAGKTLRIPTSFHHASYVMRPGFFFLRLQPAIFPANIRSLMEIRSLATQAEDEPPEANLVLTSNAIQRR